MHLDAEAREQEPLLIGADLEPLHRAETEKVQAGDFRAAHVGAGRLRAQQLAFLEVVAARNCESLSPFIVSQVRVRRRARLPTSIARRVLASDTPHGPFGGHSGVTPAAPAS